MTDTYVQLDTAILAESKGFKIYTDYVYADRAHYTIYDSRNGDEITFEYKPPRVVYRFHLDQRDNRICIAPTQASLQTWLRDTHNIDVESRVHIANGTPFTKSYQIYINGIPPTSIMYGSYEAALEAGLIYALHSITTN